VTGIVPVCPVDSSPEPDAAVNVDDQSIGQAAWCPSIP
jgi:hypothetical protein